MTIVFTPEEILGVERHFDVKWEELTEDGKFFKGIVYRYSLSPKAIANSIINPSPMDLLIREQMKKERQRSQDNETQG